MRCITRNRTRVTKDRDKPGYPQIDTGYTDERIRLLAVKKHVPEMVQIIQTSLNQHAIDCAMQFLEEHVETVEDTQALTLLALWSKDARVRAISVDKLYDCAVLLKDIARYSQFEETKIRAGTLLGRFVAQLHEVDSFMVIACVSTEQRARAVAVTSVQNNFGALKRIIESSLYEDTRQLTVDFLALRVLKLCDPVSLAYVVERATAVKDRLLAGVLLCTGLEQYQTQSQKENWIHALTRFVDRTDEIGKIVREANHDLKTRTTTLLYVTGSHKDEVLTSLWIQANNMLFSTAGKDAQELLRAFKFIALAALDTRSCFAARVIPLAATTGAVSIDTVRQALALIEKYAPNIQTRQIARDELIELSQQDTV